MSLLHDNENTEKAATTLPESDSAAGGHANNSANRPYSIYAKKEKWFIVSVVAIAGLFSPLTASIYFPAIPTIASAFNKSIELINLTVTIYMVMQGISPMFWGTISDYWGRRPMFIACLAVLAVSCVGLALVPTSAYWLLVLLRCFQAAGSASTVALGAGAIGDISDAAERGGFFGLYSLGALLGPCIGPVIGGVLADKLGWRSIFWFLCISSVVCLVFIVLFYPETLRAIVGDGSIRPSLVYRPVIFVVGRKKGSHDPVVDKPAPRPPNNPLLLFTYPDVVLMLVFNGVVYAVFYGVTATLSALFQQTYPSLSETDIGLCFLATGGSMIIGSVVTGKLLDRDYRAIKNQILKMADSDPEKHVDVVDAKRDSNFPLEKARLRTVPFYFVLFIACCIAYGWCIDRRVSIAVPLILQAGIGYSGVAMFNSFQTLLVDLVPSQGSSITACNNIVRCSLGATLVATIDLILQALGPGWTYVLLGGICLLLAPIIYIVRRIGPSCRAKRRKELESKGQAS